MLDCLHNTICYFLYFEIFKIKTYAMKAMIQKLNLVRNIFPHTNVTFFPFNPYTRIRNRVIKRETRGERISE